MFSYFVVGCACGYFLYPLIELVKKMVKNAFETTNSCSGNCNQGRTCNCVIKEKS